MVKQLEIFIGKFMNVEIISDLSKNPKSDRSDTLIYDVEQININIPFVDILEKILRNTGLEYTISDNVLHIKNSDQTYSKKFDMFDHKKNYKLVVSKNTHSFFSNSFGGEKSVVFIKNTTINNLNYLKNILSFEFGETKKKISDYLLEKFNSVVTDIYREDGYSGNYTCYSDKLPTLLVDTTLDSKVKILSIVEEDQEARTSYLNDNSIQSNIKYHQKKIAHYEELAKTFEKIKEINESSPTI